VRVVQRAADAVKIREQEIAIDQAVDAIVPYRLLQLHERIARDGEQLAPSAASHHGDRRLRSIALRAGGYVKCGARARTRSYAQLAMQRKSR
jgi:hypothetical protein